jgi:uncharacterized membrane protein
MEKYSDVEPITFSGDKKSTVQNRLKSKVAWMAVVSFILPILGHLKVYEKLGITEEYAKLVIDGIFAILVGFGAFNDPTNSEKF